MKRKTRKLNWKTTLLAPAAMALVLTVVAASGGFVHLDGRAYNLILRALPEPAVHPQLLLVDVDDRAVEIAGTWPIRRDIVADAVALMAEMGLERLVFDIEYVDRSPATADEELLETVLPERSATLLSETQKTLTAFLRAVSEGTVPPGDLEYYLPDVEEEFRDATQELLNIYSGLARDNDDYLGRTAGLVPEVFFTVNLSPGVQLRVDPTLSDHYRNSIALQGVRGQLDTLPEASAILPTILPVVRYATGAGFPNVVIDPDGVRRRVNLLYRHQTGVYGQLGFAPLLSMLGSPAVEVSRDAFILDGVVSDDPMIPERIEIPRAVDGSMLINWPRGSYLDSFRHLSFGLLLEHNRLVDALVRNIGIRERWGYLDGYRGSASAQETALSLVEKRREAVYSGNRILLHQYGADVDLFLAGLDRFFREKQNDDTFLSAIDEARSAGRVSAGDADFIENDYPIWSAAVSGQVSDLIAIRVQLRESIGGSFAILGNAATGTTDIGVNPFHGQYVNVGTHPAVVNTILMGAFLDDRPWYVSMVLAALLGFLLAVLIRTTGPLLSAVVDLGVIAVGVLVTAGCARILGIVLSPVPLLINNIGIYAVFTVIKFRAAEKEKGFIRDAFSHYLSEDVIHEVLEDPSKLALGGEKRYLTAMFTDVKGFSTISEQLDPEDLVLLLNRYLSQMSDVILDESGTIDKYEGDAIIAFFGAPIQLKDHAPRACRSAVLMKKIEQELNREFLSHALTPGPLLTRIGINTGEMVVGNMGTERKMNYTMMGNSVNLAARLEGVNKQYGTWILISETTKSEIGDDFLTRRLDRVRVVGINTPVRLYELVDIRSQAAVESLDLIRTFDAGLTAYEDRDFVRAHRYFSGCLEIDPNDGPARTFLAKTETWLENDPTEEWDAVVNLTSK